MDTTFTFNEAATTPFSVGRGGAIYGKFGTDADALLDIKDTKITENIAFDGGGVFVDMPYVGHGDANGSEFTMQKTLVDSNRATNRGGGIFTGVGSGGEVLIQDSILTGNDAGLTLSGFNGELNNSGGGLYAYLFSDATAAMLTIAGTEVSSNTAGEHGGGIAVCTKRESSTAAISRLDVYNSTISGNEAGHTTGANVGGTGGGVHLAIFPGQAEEALIARFENVTVTENRADTGGGIYSFNQTNTTYSAAENDVALTNTIISGNNQHDIALNTPGDVNNFWGSINANATRYNLFGHEAGIKANTFFDHDTHAEIFFNNLGAGNLNNNGTNDPGLGPLQLNGGPTKTHAPLPGSEVIDKGEDPYNGTQLYDQRGEPFARVIDGRVDIGAVELQPFADFDTDSDVDGFDFLAWQRGFGTATNATKADGDADNDEDVDSDDLAVWESQFGMATAGAGSSSSMMMLGGGGSGANMQASGSLQSGSGVQAKVTSATKATQKAVPQLTPEEAARKKESIFRMQKVFIESLFRGGLMPDITGDGLIDRDDLRAFVEPMLEINPAAEAERLIREVRVSFDSVTPLSDLLASEVKDERSTFAAEVDAALEPTGV